MQSCTWVTPYCSSPTRRRGGEPIRACSRSGCLTLKRCSRVPPSGAVLVTAPTPFYGALTLARVQDPWGNLWWLYQPVPGLSDPKPSWEGGPDTVFRTLDEHLRITR